MRGWCVVRAMWPLAAVVVASTAFAQAGDRADEPQPELPEAWRLPPAPVLSPEEALASFVLEPGFRVELVAREPLVEDPVAFAFDEDGRLWVVEMRGFMPTVDGEGELDPVGMIAVLEDTDGDGRMDRRQVFLDHLVLPRAVAPTHGGALIISPPDLIFARDTDGDGRADDIRVLASDLGGLTNPEHAGNGLVRGIDNRFHLSQHPRQYRFDGDMLIQEATPGHGQWGLAMDDLGRFYYSPNSDPLRADLVPLHYGSRNPNLGALTGVDERIVHDMRVWPIRPTPGVNRGYQKDFLTPDARLVSVTAACGPAIERGGVFPVSHRGNAFVCEPSANLIKRYVLMEEPDGRLTGRPAEEGREFLASTDERFRPVNLCFGPDGALYVADFYRGILQHRVFMTTFLRKQVIERGLDRPIGLGRIWRIVPTEYEHRPPPRLSRATAVELVADLAHPVGWRRDTAQRLLVERRAKDAAALLERTAFDAPSRLAAIHAMWTLEGLGMLSPSVAQAGLASGDPWIRVHALRLLESDILDDECFGRAVALLKDESPLVRVQAALTIGARTDEPATAALHEALNANAADRRMRSAVFSGLAGRERPFLTRLLADSTWQMRRAGLGEAVSTLADCIFRANDATALTRLIEEAADPANPLWARQSLLSRVAAVQRLDTSYPKTLVLASEPRGWVALREGSDELAALAGRIHQRLSWPGHNEQPRARLLTPQENETFRKGQRLYDAFCFSCHQENGRGQPGVAPSLVGTEWVLGPPERLIRIMLHGLRGPLEVDGMTFNGDMPRSPAGGDEQIAQILTFIRRSWGNAADPVPPELVRQVRQATADRVDPWTVAELRSVDQ